MTDYLAPQTMVVSLTLGLIILLPLIPAFILFRALPSTAEVNGPLQGLNLKLGGAFAGYFAMVVLIFSTHSIWNPPPPYQVWELVGQVTDDSGRPIEPLDTKDISLNPPQLESQAQGAFKLQFTTWPGQGGSTEYPTLSISHGDLAPVRIDLDPSAASDDKSVQLTWDTVHRRIRIKTISLSKLPEYGSTGNTVQALPISK